MQNNSSSPLDKYLQYVANFQGMMNQLASSIEIVLDDILRKIGINPPKMLGEKISKFKENVPNLNKYNANLDELLLKLTSFNANWVLSKHGMPATGNLKDIAFFKDGIVYVFDNKKIEDIKHEFTFIQEALIEIHRKLTYDCGSH